jgi:hypothetical protein
LAIESDDPTSLQAINQFGLIESLCAAGAVGKSLPKGNCRSPERHRERLMSRILRHCGAMRSGITQLVACLDRAQQNFALNRSKARDNG